MAWEKNQIQQSRGPNVAWWPENPQGRESMGKLLSDLAAQSANLVRDEVALARQELREKLKSVESAAITIVAGAIIGLVALLSLSAAVILALAEYMRPWQSALIVGLGLAVTAAIIVTLGLSHLKRTRLKPEQTFETFEENKEWLKELT